MPRHLPNHINTDLPRFFLLSLSQIDLNEVQAYRFTYEFGATRHSYSIWRCNMGPTKTIVKGTGIYDARTGKVIKEGLSTQQAIQDYAAHHYIVLPEVDHQGHPWELNGQFVYCLHGVRYETLDDQEVHLTRCHACGGMGTRVEEITVERDCLRCIQCGQELDARLEMMES